jgi:hypothetical protein
MFEKKRMQRMPAGKSLNPAGRRDGGNGRCASSGSLPWYAAQPEGATVKYVLTTNGYAVL